MTSKLDSESKGGKHAVMGVSDIRQKPPHGLQLVPMRIRLKASMAGESMGEGAEEVVSGRSTYR